MIISTESKEGKNIYVISLSMLFSFLLYQTVTTVFKIKVISITAMIFVLISSFVFACLYIIFDLLKDYVRYEFRVKKSKELYTERLNIFAFGEIFQLFKKQSNGTFYTYINVFHYLVVNHRADEMFQMQDRLKVLKAADIRCIYIYKYLNMFTLTILISFIAYITFGIATVFKDDFIILAYCGVAFYGIYFYYCIVMSRKYENLRIKLFSKGLVDFTYNKKNFI